MSSKGKKGKEISSYLDHGSLPFRLSFLYSSLPPRKLSNPPGYAAAIQSWHEILRSLTSNGLLHDHDKLILHVDDHLTLLLRRENIGRPVSLGAVITELSSTSTLVPLSSYRSYLAASSSSSSRTSTSSTSWISLSLLTKPLWWSLSQLGLASSSSSAGVSGGEGQEEKEWKARKGDWVWVELVEKSAKTLLPKLAALHADPLDRLYTPASFWETVKGLCLESNADGDEDKLVELSEKDCWLVAEYLRSKGECAISETDEQKILKFRAPFSSSPPLPLTPTDSSTLTLLRTLSTLTLSATSLTSLLDSQTLKVQQSLKSLASVTTGKGERERSTLKREFARQKTLEKRLTEAEDRRSKVEDLVEGLRRAKGNEELLDAVKVGTQVLKEILKNPTLSLENVEKTTEEMRETLEKGKELDEAVEVGTVGVDGVDEDELEKEFKELLEKEEEEKKRKEEEKERKLEEERVEKEAKKLAEIVGAVQSPALPTLEKKEEPSSQLQEKAVEEKKAVEA